VLSSFLTLLSDWEALCVSDYRPSASQSLSVTGSTEVLWYQLGLFSSSFCSQKYSLYVNRPHFPEFFILILF
jgi:hypothetical protein